MPILLSLDALRKIYPKASPEVHYAFASDAAQSVLAAAGISESPQRLATALAHCSHETAGFSIRNLTENINYTHQRMAAVWPNRFPSADAVRDRYGSGPGWQKKAFDDIYGNRMGNRPGTSDGSNYIGRGGPQITGRDGYREVGKRANLPLEDQPALACLPENQPKILAGFWTWKGLNKLADSADPIGATVRPWNGGTNGLAERRSEYARILPIVQRLTSVPDLPDPPSMPPDIPAPEPVNQQPASGGFFSILLSAIFKRK